MDEESPSRPGGFGDTGSEALRQTRETRSQVFENRDIRAMVQAFCFGGPRLSPATLAVLARSFWTWVHCSRSMIAS